MQTNGSSSSSKEVIGFLRLNNFSVGWKTRLISVDGLQNSLLHFACAWTKEKLPNQRVAQSCTCF
jgi:hypothetical protein